MLAVVRTTAFDLRASADLLVLESGELQIEDFDRELGLLLDQVEDKAGAYRAVYYALSDARAAVVAEKERFAAREKVLDSQLDRLKANIRVLLEAKEAVGEKPKVTAAWGSMWLQVNSQPSVDAPELAKVPDEFLVVPPPPPRELNRDLLLARFRDAVVKAKEQALANGNDLDNDDVAALVDRAVADVKVAWASGKAVAGVFLAVGRHVRVK